jgi:hypothetical protein
MEHPIQLSKPRAIYVTAQDRKAKRSKTMTLRGYGLTPEAVIEILNSAIRKRSRKAGWPMGRRINRGRHAITVSVYDKAESKSVSFTVSADHSEFETLVSRLYDAAQALWSTTLLNDRRHKRR